MNEDKTRVLAVPVIYAFLPDKKASTYEKFLSHVRELTNHKPTSIACDFEAGIIRAATKVYPEAKMSLCATHYQRSVKRKIEKLGLKERLTCPSKTKFNFTVAFECKQLVMWF